MKITAIFSAEGDTRISYSAKYLHAEWIDKADFLQDVIADLTDEYNKVLSTQKQPKIDKTP